MEEVKASAKELTEEVDTEMVRQLLRGERPEGMSYEEFKIKRIAVKKYLKQRNKGKLVYLSKEFATDIDPETKEKKDVIKVYPVFKRTEPKKIGRIDKWTRN